jgi:biotin transport system permease protein
MTELYHYPPTLLHRIPAGAKLFALAALSILFLQIERAPYVAATFAAICLVFIALGPSVAKRLLLLKPLWPIIAAIFLSQFYIVGSEAAVVAVTRLCAMVLLADLVTMSTPMQSMMDAVNTILYPLRHFSLDIHRVSFCVALVIRFVPLLLNIWRMQAEALRGRTRRRAGWKLILPFLANVLRMADRTAESLDARGFGLRPLHSMTHREK